MKYYSNFIGSFFGFGKPIMAVPDLDDIAGMPRRRIEILEIIAGSATLDNLLYKDNPEARDKAANLRIKAQKMADYQEDILKNNGYYGHLDLAKVDQIHKDMREDWWLNDPQPTNS